MSLAEASVTDLPDTQHAPSRLRGEREAVKLLADAIIVVMLIEDISKQCTCSKQ